MKNKVTITLKNIGSEKTGAVMQWTAKVGRKIIGKVFEPCKVLGDKYTINIPIAPGYCLQDTATTAGHAFAKMEALTDGKYNILPAYYNYIDNFYKSK